MPFFFSARSNTIHFPLEITLLFAGPTLIFGRLDRRRCNAVI
jgi:hypothetical protein